MIAGRQYWIVIWYGILALGILGLWAGIFWGRRTAWKNLDEVLRASGTIAVSVGMLLLLHDRGGWLGEALLVAALFAFLTALIYARRQPRERREEDPGADGDNG
jgi:cytochrome c biogenesis protein ResB